MSGTEQAALFIIFGGTGDLSRRKLLPSLCSLAEQGYMNDRTQIVGLGRGALSNEAFQGTAREALKAAKFSDDAIERFVRRVHYQTTGEGKPEDYKALAKRLDDISRARDVPPNRAFYMSLPPEAFKPTVLGLGEAGLNQSAGWVRLVIEKPFGKDLESARELNALIHRYFSEEQIYRIDHYLGKETVQNLLVFRLANGLIESAWNRERVDSVQITVAESLGVGTRAGYYDSSGALRDMVQNHISQLLTLIAMEVPASFDAESIRYEKIKVLRTIAPIRTEHVVRGQYTAGTVEGKKTRSYLEEEGVPKGSDTETFVALKLFVDSWRWQGVPFYIRTGKYLPKKTTQIAVLFREAPVSFFSRLGCTQDTADILKITLQPDEGFSFYFDIKAPGEPFRLERIPLRFSYSERYAAFADGYQTLLLDVIHGDQTLFVHSAEVEESWRVFMPVLKNPPKARPYAAGTWGPPEADPLAIPEADIWQKE